jgi:protein-S-isoprenylcysteine O-methyltransferase Ste14
MNLYQKWAKREHSLGMRILGTLPAGAIFAFLIPYTLLFWLPPLDTRLKLPSLFFGIINIVVGGLILAIGFFFAVWSIYSQFTRARGTPLPMMATQKLLADGPFRLCRNPMGLGTVLMYLGISLLMGSICDIAFTLLFLGLFTVYVKSLEEKELAARFGQAYLDYKTATPFMLPRIISRK